MRALAFVGCAAMWVVAKAAPASLYAQADSGSADQTVVEPTPLPAPEDSAMESAVALAGTDAANRVGVSADEVALIKVEPAEWPSINLGCPGLVPRPIRGQSLVQGFLVELEAGGIALTYHTDDGQRAVVCPRQVPVGPIYPGPREPPPDVPDTAAGR